MAMNLSNLFKGNAFSFKIARCPTVSSLSTAVILPSISMGSTEVPFPPLMSKDPGSRLTYSEMLVTFNLDENWNAYMECYDWLMDMRDPTTSVWADIKQDASIIVYNNSNKAILDISFSGCFPTNLDDIPFSAAESDNVSMSVTFEYDYFKVNRLSD